MHYHVFFDLARVGFKQENFGFLLPGLVLTGLGLGCVIFREHLTSPERRRPMPRSFPVVFLIFGMLWTLISASTLYMRYREVFHALAENRVSVVEGRVLEFKPMPWTGQSVEQFCVSESDVCFSYSDFTVTPGFNQTSSHGGPIRENLPVRITYIENMILRLEVGE